MSERPTLITFLDRQHCETAAFEETPPPATLIRYAGAKNFSLICPGCGLGAGLDDHTVQETAPGIFTLSPSCICPREHCKAHYYVRENRIDWI